MPFGLKNAPATFQRAMDSILRNFKWQSALVYIDDIIIFSKTYDQHLLDVQAVLECIEQASFFLRPEKCHFCVPEILYLGHVVSADGVRTDPAKIKKVLEIANPKNIVELRRFLGLAGYYRKFVQNFSRVVEPLRKLLYKDVTWNWTKECSAAVETIKHLLTVAPILAFPDFSETAEPMELYIDATACGLGAILCQKQNNALCTIAYASRATSATESNYAPTELECLGL